MRLSLLSVFLLLAPLSKPLYGLILVGGGNAVNITNPATGAPWDEVAKVTKDDNLNVIDGTAVHLGGGYMLTANHVSLSNGFVSFDGIHTFQIAPGSAVQVASGVDLKVFQLTSNPGSNGVNLLPEINKGVELLPAFSQATHIGWGVGHDPSDTSNPWTWGDRSTSAKRWGVNEFSSATILSYSGYTQESLVTELDSDATLNEAGAAFYDSGSGMFIEDAANNWFLAGTIVTVSTAGSSTFGTAGEEDFNYSVRIAEYTNEIISLMTDPIPVPESSAFALIFGGVSLLILNRRRSVAPAGTPGCRRFL